MTAIPSATARKVLGGSQPNFFGLQENLQFFGARPLGGLTNFDSFSEVPFSEKVLEETKDDFFLVSVLQFSIIQLHEKFPNLFCGQEWFLEEPFATETAQSQCILMSKTPLAGGATGQTFPDQLKLLAASCEVPTAREVVYAIVAYNFLSGGKWLFENCSVRTSSTSSSAERHPIDVGVSTIKNAHYQPGIIINYSHPLTTSHAGQTRDLGLAFKRKPI